MFRGEEKKDVFYRTPTVSERVTFVVLRTSFFLHPKELVGGCPTRTESGTLHTTPGSLLNTGVNAGVR